MPSTFSIVCISRAAILTCYIYRRRKKVPTKFNSSTLVFKNQIVVRVDKIVGYYKWAYGPLCIIYLNENQDEGLLSSQQSQSTMTHIPPLNTHQVQKVSTSYAYKGFQQQCSPFPTPVLVQYNLQQIKVKYVSNHKAQLSAPGYLGLTILVNM